MKKLGFLVNNLGPSQLSFNLINNTNAFVGSEPQTDVIAFYEQHRRACIAMHFGAMQLMEAWAYEAPIVATSLSTASKALRFPTAQDKFFYVWDLEWVRGVAKPFDDMASVYRNDGLQIIARSIDHKLAIESAWNRPVIAVIEDFDMPSFMRLTNE